MLPNKGSDTSANIMSMMLVKDDFTFWNFVSTLALKLGIDILQSWGHLADHNILCL